MRFKILNIKGCATCKQVLLFIDRDDDGVDKVVIKAWHFYDGSYLIQEQSLEFDNIGFGSMECFIADYSQETANYFANQFSI